MNLEEYMGKLRQKALSDCRGDQVFWTCHGHTIRNIYELAGSIDNMNDDVFRYHVNEEGPKNDFLQWILEALGDGELARRLKKVRDRQEYAKIIRDRIAELEEF